jgi:hypothetical protein
MLKTQSAAFPLPVGCPWSPRHPITERIAMLKSNPPSPRNRRIGRTLLTALAASAAGVVYAASPATQQASTTAKADHFTLAIDAATRGHPASMHFTRCIRAGEPFDVSGSDGPGFSWGGQFAVTPAAKGQLEVRGKIHTRVEQGRGATREMSGQPVVRTLPGVKASIVFGQKVDGQHLDTVKLADNTVWIDITPTPGCSSGTVRDGGMVSAGKSGLVMARGAAADAVAAPREYQLNLSVALATNLGRGENVRRANLALCTNAGKTATVKVHDWQIDVTPMQEGTHRLRLDVHMSGADHQLIAQASLQGAVDGVMHAGGKSIDGKSDYSMDITSLDGCPARAEEAERKSAHA